METFTRSSLITTVGAILMLSSLLYLTACGDRNDKQAGAAPGPQAYPVFTVTAQSATLNVQYPATLQGVQNIEIRPKVDGFVDRIYVDEGAVVRKGQLLFTLSAPQYQQELNTASAAIHSAEADVAAARLQVNKARPLVEKEIISHYELEAAELTLQSRMAALAQSRAAYQNAKTNLGYTSIASPVDGVVGALPFKTGSLVSSTNAQPLTTVSNIQKVYAYFSLNEKQLLDFARHGTGTSLAQKISNMPAVQLILSDGSVYPEAGHVETIGGLITTETGSASLRAGFPNTQGLIRSGGSATVRIPRQVTQSLLIPQRSTYELQGKHFVYVVGAGNVVSSVEIGIMDLPAGQYYVATSGLKAGDKVVYEGAGTLKDSTLIKPEPMASDKVFQDVPHQ